MTHQDVFEVVIDNFLNGPCDFDPRGLPSLIYDNPIAPRIFSVFLLRIFAYNDGKWKRMLGAMSSFGNLW